MFALGALSFIAPIALFGLIALPVIYWLLRVIPPAPRRVRFPAIRLVMRLINPEESSAKTPLWLTLLRLALVTLVILGAAHPLLNAANQFKNDGPLVVVIDDDWAAAKNWNKRQTAVANLIDQAERDNRALAIVTTAPGEGKTRIMESLLSPEAAREIVRALKPKPWQADRRAAASVINDIKLDGRANIFWLSNGLDNQDADEFANTLTALGDVVILAGPASELPVILLPPTSDRDGLTLRAKRSQGSNVAGLKLRIRDDQGAVISRKTLIFEAGKSDGKLKLELPVEIRNRITQIEIENGNSAAGTVLVDERWRRRPVGLVTGAGRKSDQPLLDDLFYLNQALDPFTEVRTGSIAELLKRELALLILADPGKISASDRSRLNRWIAGGGIVLRFAGPRLASDKNPYLPVRLRQGDRELGGALSWTKPASLAPFVETGPFAGLAIPKDVRIRRQVLAQPTVELPGKTWARLSDGTPLVTAEKKGDGWLVFVHTMASPGWSNLPLSGLFVGMLQNLVQFSRGVVGETAERLLPPLQTVDGFGRLGPARPGARALKSSAFGKMRPGPDHPPGFYGDETARRAFNLSPTIISLDAIGRLGGGVTRKSYQSTRETDLRAWLLTAALVLAIADIIASLALRGFLVFSRAAAAALIFSFGIAAMATGAHAQTAIQPPIQSRADNRDFAPALKVRIGYIETGNRSLDSISRAGLSGLAFVANSRTAAELGEPVAIDPATDELAFFPLIYWPITEDTPVIGPAVAAKINAYMKSGGTVFFDTRDRGGGSFASDRLEEISRNLDIPPLTAIPSDHVLTKAYYLLREFPGRWTGGRVWVARDTAGTNDGVSPVIVGSHDWAAAWAMDETRKPQFPVVPGGERQREMAYRFGINLLMYVLTGNYKADQVHVPAIMERLGQ